MSLELLPHGRAMLMDPYWTRLKPKFNDFEFKRAGENTWDILCPGKDIRYPIARFTGTYIDGVRALKMLLITTRLCL